MRKQTESTCDVTAKVRRASVAGKVDYARSSTTTRCLHSWNGLSESKDSVDIVEGKFGGTQSLASFL
jgi:hypothetical protein